MTRILNPAIRRVAGRRHMAMAAQIRHRGRRSGHEYVTPASARLSGDEFFIPLTFTSRSDWCQNVLAAGTCTIRWRGVDYPALRPELTDRRSALAASGRAFKRRERVMLKMLGVEQFLRLQVDVAAMPTAMESPPPRRGPAWASARR
ncbi:MAG: nitroreductase [Acidimicrobiales bacterium]